MNHDSNSLYERVGGEEGIVTLVDAFYKRVLQDDGLAGFFENVQVGRLKNMQKEFFTISLGAEGNYSDMNLAHAHHGKNINPEHFRAFSNHLMDTLAEFDLSEEDRYQIISRINMFVDDIVEIDATGVE